MNATHNRGGPAFPATSWTRDGEFLGDNQGMTLRDYFAAKAMQANLARLGPGPGYSMAAEAKYAYEWADAMLKARKA